MTRFLTYILCRSCSYQRRSGKCQLIFLLILLICGAFIVLLYRPERHSGPPETPGEGVGISDGMVLAGPDLDTGLRWSLRTRATSKGRDAKRFIGANRRRRKEETPASEGAAKRRRERSDGEWPFRENDRRERRRWE